MQMNRNYYTFPSRIFSFFLFSFRLQFTYRNLHIIDINRYSRHINNHNKYICWCRLSSSLHVSIFFIRCQITNFRSTFHFCCHVFRYGTHGTTTWISRSLYGCCPIETCVSLKYAQHSACNRKTLKQSLLISLWNRISQKIPMNTENATRHGTIAWFLNLVPICLLILYRPSNDTCTLWQEVFLHLNLQTRFGDHKFSFTIINLWAIPSDSLHLFIELFTKNLVFFDCFTLLSHIQWIILEEFPFLWTILSNHIQFHSYSSRYPTDETGTVNSVHDACAEFQVLHKRTMFHRNKKGGTESKRTFECDSEIHSIKWKHHTRASEHPE